MYLVTKSKSYFGNVLGYCPKTEEYVYFHFGKEIWREKGDRKLLEICSAQRSAILFVDHEELLKFPVYRKYSESCGSFMRF